MISNNCFIENFQKYQDLYAWKLNKERLKKIWYYLNEQEFSDSDLLQALQNCDPDAFRFVEFLSLMKAARSERIEIEQRKKQEQEELDVRLWFKDHPRSKQNCVNDYECGGCKRIYCDIVAKTAQNMIKKILNREISGKEAHKVLTEQFRKIGFEQYTDIELF